MKTKGLWAACIILGCWLLGTIFLFSRSFQTHSIFLLVWVPVAILVQMHLYTGLFITAHDAMHGSIHPKKSINTLIGRICTLLYAGFFYSRLFPRHHKHHQQVHTENDPDFYRGNFFVWYFHFFKNYFTWYQYLLLNAVFFLLRIWVQPANLILFWIVPSVLSSLQLFYFGTYLPHKGEHDNPYQSASQKKNHAVAFLSCYFFGYHYEHHDSPGTPWWQLYKRKEISNG